MDTSSAQYVKDTKAAQILDVAVQTLRNHRHQGRGLPYCKIGRTVLYSLDDIKSYLDSKKIVPEAR